MVLDPRRRLLGRVDDTHVFRVDGALVRDRIDVEFTNGAHHFHAPYVPECEIWLDREAAHEPGRVRLGDDGEWRFWALYQQQHRAAMAEGQSYLAAVERAERVERRARRRALGLRGRISKRALADLARRRRLGVRAGCAVWLVRGRVIRDLAFLHFTLGGHDRVYAFVPSGEVWIDDAVAPAERAAVLHHELVERELMDPRGAALTYAEAHARASSAEVHFRRGAPLVAAGW
jgi:hypothetical protein